MNNESPSLCAPDREKSCFACCPPIRPSGYEHITYRWIIHRELLNATKEFDGDSDNVRSITGYSCWALGYLDRRFRRVGCLLHPNQNRGRDLRCRVDYGEKCSRESCEESRMFDLLAEDVRRYYIALTHGLDSFSYSSRKENPLFTLVWWGTGILTYLAHNGDGKAVDRATFFSKFPLFASGLDPRKYAYLVSFLVSRHGEAILKNKEIAGLCRNFWEDLRREFIVSPLTQASRPYVHTLQLDPLFARFLRYGLGIARITKTEADTLRLQVDARINRFCHLISR
jgi:hypothetical protein